MDRDSFIAELDAENNPSLVRSRLAEGFYSPQYAAYSKSWLENQDSNLASSAAKRKEDREIQALKYSKWSLCFSLIAIFISIIALFVKFINK